MEQDQEQLPLARMVTISKPSFWVFLVTCFALYLCEWQHNQEFLMSGYDHEWALSQFVTTNHIIIISVLAIGLLLNIIIVSIKNKPSERILTVCTYVYEVASVIFIAFLIFFKH